MLTSAVPPLSVHFAENPILATSVLSLKALGISACWPLTPSEQFPATAIELSVALSKFGTENVAGVDARVLAIETATSVLYALLPAVS